VHHVSSSPQEDYTIERSSSPNVHPSDPCLSK
jgi:hypothetical protein